MDQDKLNSISSYLSKLLRKNFGRGPQSCQSIVNQNIFITYIQGFISPMEEVLMEQGQSEQVDKARSVIINHLLDQLRGVVEVSLNCEIEESYHDWNFPNNSGIILFFLNREVIEESNSSDAIDIDIEKLEAEVARISLLVQKIPEQIHVYPVSATTYLIVRKGILIPIEKALIAKGYEEELKITKDELEKKYFHRYGKYEQIFRKTVKDIFIDWSFKDDKSVMVYFLS